MLFVYKPEGAEPKRWEFDAGKIMSPEAEAIERLTGMDFAPWSQRVLEGSMLATRGLLYVLLKRENPTLKPESVQFSMSEIDWELDADETAEAIEALREAAKARPLAPEEEAALTELLESQGHAPKDPEVPSESDAAST